MKLDQIIISKLSIAVCLVDDFRPDGEVLGKVRVIIPELKLGAIKNPSGYYIFINIPDGSYTLQIKPEYYIDKEIPDVRLPSSDNPTEVKLIPSTLYPFPSGTTLLRGVVKDTGCNPVSDAEIVVASVESTRTSERGEFVIYFPVSREDASSIRVKVTPKGKSTKEVRAAVRRGKTTFKTIIYP